MPPKPKAKAKAKAKGKAKAKAAAVKAKAKAKGKAKAAPKVKAVKAKEVEEETLVEGQESPKKKPEEPKEPKAKKPKEKEGKVAAFLKKILDEAEGKSFDEARPLDDSFLWGSVSRLGPGSGSGRRGRPMLALPLVVLARDALHRRPRAPFCACEPQSTLRGVCPSGVRYYAARAHLGESEARTGALERAHVFALAEGGAAAQAAAELPQLAVAAWRQVLEEDAAAEVAAESLSRAFAWCDQRLAVSEPSSGLVCAVLRSGIYVASCGLARTAVGTDVDGLTVLCDEASVPHDALSESELARVGQGAPPKSLPWRALGAKQLKEKHPGIIALPDVVRIQHSSGTRLVLLASEAVWAQGPRKPVLWAMEALRAGRCPAAELLKRADAAMAAAM
ncbi:unnamed protein product, partial [Effrenium voratum]